MTRRNLAAVLMAAVIFGAGLAAARADEAQRVPAKANAGTKGAAKLAIGVSAPEIDATDLAGKAVTLASLQGKPVVLQFGSLTEPVFRMRATDSEKLAAQYGDKVTFVVVYGREAHAADGSDSLQANEDAGFAIARPVNEGERARLAEQAKERLHLSKQLLLVDSWSDTSSLRYGGYPNMTFVIDAQGKLQAGYAWMDPAKVRGALRAMLAGKEVPEEDRGQTKPGVPAALDYGDAVKNFDGYRGGALALTIDGIKMTDAQKAVIYPALGDYLAEGKILRERFGNGKGGPPKKPEAAAASGEKGKADGANTMDGDKTMAGNSAAGVTGGAGGGAGGAGAVKPPEVNAEDFAAAVKKTRAAAQKLKAACQDNLSPKDAKTILSVLEQGPARRLFAD